MNFYYDYTGAVLKVTIMIFWNTCFWRTFWNIFMCRVTSTKAKNYLACAIVDSSMQNCYSNHKQFKFLLCLEFWYFLSVPYKDIHPGILNLHRLLYLKANFEKAWHHVYFTDFCKNYYKNWIETEPLEGQYLWYLIFSIISESA